MRRRFIKNILKIVYIKNNEIWYTNGSNIIPTQPHHTDAFNTSIISTVYSAKIKNWVITFDNDVTSIGYGAFAYCDGLTSITIPDSVTTIKASAFEDCPNLKRVNISNLSVWYKISFNSEGNPLCNGANLYVNDELVTDVVIPSDITSVNSYLFHGCTSIRSVIIPEGVTSIGYGAFEDCDSLTSVYCKATTPPAGTYSMFDNNASGRKIYVPMESVEAYKSAEYWSKYADAIVGYNF